MSDPKSGFPPAGSFTVSTLPWSAAGAVVNAAVTNDHLPRPFSKFSQRRAPFGHDGAASPSPGCVVESVESGAPASEDGAGAFVSVGASPNDPHAIPTTPNVPRN